MIRALIYGDSNLNVIDGSSVWITSISAVLSEVVDEVHVLLKTPVTNDRLLAAVEENAKVYVHAHREGRAVRDEIVDPLDSRESALRLAQLTKRISPALVIVRGLDACAEAARDKPLASRLWAYVTDLPFPLSRASEHGISRLRRIAANSKRMLSQTESSRAYLEAIAPEAAGKTVLLPPMVPNSFFATTPNISDSHPESLQLVYAGKFAKDWRTFEMLELPALLAERGIDAKLTFIGDKFQRDRQDPSWHIRMKEALGRFSADPESSVRWLGGMARADVAAHIRKADIGLGWRSRSMNSSLELSSKLIEYGASGTSPLINRTADHEALFGKDYPLFIDKDDISHVADTILRGVSTLGKTSEVSLNAARRYSYESATNRLRTELTRSSTLDTVRVEKRVTRLGIATHDMKFMGDLLDMFLTMPDINPQIDIWKTLHENDANHSREVLAWADTILCEWAGPNAVWYSNNKRPGTNLIVRLHAFELKGPWLQRINIDAVDQWIFVSEPYRQLTITQLGLDPARCQVIHNGLNTDDYDRPKSPGAQFHIGLAGYVTYNKRPDRALDLLENLIEHDERYTLHIKGRAPWEYEYEWKKPAQKLAYEDFFSRIHKSRQLSESVIFEPFSPDIASWLRKIGIMLSPSNSESFHLAPAEGMASGAVPVIWQRAGAEEIFGAQYIVHSAEEAAEAILRLRPESFFSRESSVAKMRAKGWDAPIAHDLWKGLLRE